MRAFYFLLAVLSLSFAGQVWQKPLEGEVVELVESGSSLIVATSEALYSFSLGGTRKWTYEGGVDVFEAEAGNVYGRVGSSVVRISDGREVWKKELNRTIFALSLSPSGVYVSADDGVYLLDKSTGDVQKVFNTTAVFVGKPKPFGSGFIINLKYQNGSVNTAFVRDGGIVWSVESAEMWPYEPFVIGNLVYLYDLEGKVRAIANGRVIWTRDVQSAVLTKPVESGDVLVVGTAKGEVYGLDKSTGAVRWRAKLPSALAGRISLGKVGGKDVVFVKAADRSIYAVDFEGNVVWKGGDGNRPSSPLFSNNLLFFAADDLYAFNTERACSILFPPEGSILDKREVDVGGSFISAFPNARVLISINDGEWMETESSGGQWSISLEPTEVFESTLNEIRCKVVDSNGEERGPLYTSVLLIYDEDAPEGVLAVSIEGEPKEGEKLILKAFDVVEGKELKSFSYSINGGVFKEVREGRAVISLESGTHQIVVRKPGYRESSRVISVASSSSPVFFIVVGLLLIAAILVAFKKDFIKLPFSSLKK